MTTTVATVAALIAALNAGAAGSVITLAPGDYSGVSIVRVAAPGVTITGPGAVLHDLTLESSSGLTFQDLTFDASAVPVGPGGNGGTFAFVLRNDSDITFAADHVTGDPKWTLAQSVRAFQIQASPHVTFTGDLFEYLHDAVAESDSDYFTFSGNTCRSLRDDCIDSSGSGWVTITGNQCYGNHPDGPADPGHPDCIQFWTKNDARPSHDIDIERNTYLRGSGQSTQFIFMRANYPAPFNLPFTNVTIKDNRAWGSDVNAIAVNGATQVDVEGNAVVAYCQPAATDKVIIKMAAVAGLTLKGNSASVLVTPGSTGTVQSANVATPCVAQAAP